MHTAFHRGTQAPDIVVHDRSPDRNAFRLTVVKPDRDGRVIIAIA